MVERSADSLLNPLAHPICLTRTDYLPPSAWKEHLPFGMFLVCALRPQVLVELGTYYGCSYCAFCRAVAESGLDTRCFAVDTWQGDPHASQYGSEVLNHLRAYHDSRYGHFSQLIQGTFDEALPSFADASIDLLHIDGYHTYETVRRDFENWLPKLSPRSIVLFHDTAVRKEDFGVWRLWEELQRRYRGFEFPHGSGLGVLAPGDIPGGEVGALLCADGEKAEAIRHLFLALGREVIRSEEELQREAERESWQQVESQLAAVLNSASWRLTAPLRKVISLLRGEQVTPPAASCSAPKNGVKD